MNNIQANAIVRQRKQLTIPSELAEAFPWLVPNSVITFHSEAEDRLVVEPYREAIEKTINWKQLKANLAIVRSFKGKGKQISLSKFIVMDRERH